MSKNVKNTISRPDSSGLNRVDLEQGGWSIDGDPVTASAADLNGGGGGGVTDGNNLGGGEGLFESTAGGIMNFKSVTAGSNITLTPSGTELEISSAAGDITGANNLGAGEGVFANEAAGILNFKSFIAGTNVNFDVTGDTLTVNSDGATLPVILNFQYVANSGNDANTGTSLDQPKATFAAAIAALGAPVLPNIGVVVCLDSGPYAEGISITNDNIFIDAPRALFVPPANVDGLNINATNAVTSGGRLGGFITSGTGVGINIVDAGGWNVQAGICDGFTVNSTTGGSGVHRFDSLNGDINITGAVSRGEALIFTGSVNNPNAIIGWHGAVMYGSSRFEAATQPKILRTTTVTTGQTITSFLTGSLLRVFGAGATTLNLPSDAQEDLPDGSWADIVRIGTGTVTFVPTGGATIVGSATQIASQGGVARVYKVDNDTWSLSGNVS